MPMHGCTQHTVDYIIHLKAAFANFNFIAPYYSYIHISSKWLLLMIKMGAHAMSESKAFVFDICMYVYSK